MSIFSDIGDWIGDNKDWLKPVASLVTGGLNQSNKDNGQSQYLEYLKQKELQNYYNSVDAINAYNTQLAAAGGGGGGGGGGSNDAARMAAAKKANKVTQRTYKKLLGMYEPFKETTNRLLPQMTGAYENSLNLQKSLLDYVNQPQQMAKLDAPVPAWKINVPVPDSVRIK